MIYILNLPRTPSDLIKFDDDKIILFNSEWQSHAIYITAIQSIHIISRPTLILCNDHLLPIANNLSRQYKSLLGAVPFSSLNEQLVKKHWMKLYQLFRSQQSFKNTSIMNHEPVLDLSSLLNQLPSNMKAGYAARSDQQLHLKVIEWMKKEQSSTVTLVTPGVQGALKKKMKSAATKFSDPSRYRFFNNRHFGTPWSHSLEARNFLMGGETQ
jgi:hypothetical protein